MRASIVLAALTSLAAAAPQISVSTGEIGLIFTFTNGSQSAQQWVADSATQVPLNSGGIVDNVFVQTLPNPAIPNHYFGASCSFLDAQSRDLGVGHVSSPGIIILESKDVIEFVQCKSD